MAHLRSKRSSRARKSGICRSRLRRKIKSYRKSRRYRSRHRAVATAFHDLLKQHPACKRVLKSKRRKSRRSKRRSRRRSRS